MSGCNLLLFSTEVLLLKNEIENIGTLQVIGLNKHSFMELLLHVCVLDHYVKIYFLTVDVSPKKFDIH